MKSGCLSAISSYRFMLASSGNSPSQTTSGSSAFFVSRELSPRVSTRPQPLKKRHDLRDRRVATAGSRETQVQSRRLPATPPKRSGPPMSIGRCNGKGADKGDRRCAKEKTRILFERDPRGSAAHETKGTRPY